MKKTKLIPLGDRVLVRPFVEKSEKTKSGIFLPESMKKEKPDEGEVIAVGEGRYIDGKLVSVNVKIGDKVIFSKYSYDEVKVDGEDLLLFREEHILAIIK